MAGLRNIGVLGLDIDTDPNLSTRSSGFNGPGRGYFQSADQKVPGPLGLGGYGPASGIQSFSGSAGWLHGTQPGPDYGLAGSTALNGASNAGLITAFQLKAIFNDATPAFLQGVADELNVNLVKFCLDTPLRRAHFFAQVREESGPGMDAQVEDMTYAPSVLKSKFAYYKDHPDEADVDGYERDPKNSRKFLRKPDKEAIANKAYSSKYGNGAPSTGDGSRFRGRGLIQVTWRDNYRTITNFYNVLFGKGDVDFEKNPEWMATYPYTVRSAVCYWVWKELASLADRGSSGADVDRITAVVNKYTDSYARRREHFKVAYAAFK